jgi:N4-gp56 family major capsid protein
MPYTTKTQIPDEVNNYYDRSLLERLLPLLVYTKYGQVRDIPRKSGTNTIKFRRYDSLTAATTPLTEGTTPAGSQLSVTDVTADALQYGDFITITDVVDYESQDATLTEAAQVLGEQAGDTIDQLCRDVLAAGTTVQYADSRAARLQLLASSLISVAEVRKGVRTMKGNNAKKITSMVDPDEGYNTHPINAAFIGICHSDTTYTLKGLTGWVPVEEYANKADVMPGEVGALDEVRFVETTNAKNWDIVNGPGSTALTVHGTIILGRNAYGITRISGEALKNIIKPLGSGGTADPLNQRATSGWKATFVAKILNENSMLRIEHAVEA